MDDADVTQRRIEREEELMKKPPYELPEGKPGDCDLCGEWSGRLVVGVCAPCRDRRGLA